MEAFLCESPSHYIASRVQMDMDYNQRDERRRMKMIA